MPTILKPVERQPESSTAPNRGWLPSPLQCGRWFLKILIQWEDRARERHQLLTMDDRMLRDIGVDRLTARGEYTKPFWRV
ncbi:MAG: DUF1127 domain-containing protein [Proteobacteria bacterium]|nr:DUF1127 domain-containing protein [Pseudomonadota bacterium]MBI3499643.1 DUF1127 domain-containing protein [Pseudomonadota bacterium]